MGSGVQALVLRRAHRPAWLPMHRNAGLLLGPPQVSSHWMCALTGAERGLRADSLQELREAALSPSPPFSRPTRGGDPHQAQRAGRADPRGALPLSVLGASESVRRNLPRCVIDLAGGHFRPSHVKT